MSETAAQSRGSYLADNTKKFTRQGFCCCQVSLQIMFLNIIYQYGPDVWLKCKWFFFS